MNDQSEKLNFIIPQWQGGGQDLCTWYGAFALRDNYLKDPEAVTVNIGSEPLSPEKIISLVTMISSAIWIK